MSYCITVYHIILYCTISYYGAVKMSLLRGLSSGLWAALPKSISCDWSTCSESGAHLAFAKAVAVDTREKKEG